MAVHMRILIIVLSLSGVARSTAFAQEGEAGSTEKLRLWRVVEAIPETSLWSLKTATRKEAIWPWVGVISSTLLLYAYDGEVLTEVQHWGRSLNIGNNENTKTVWEVGPYPILRLPSDTGSWLYFLGDGWTHALIAGSFALTGELADAPRAWNTGLEIVHGMVVSTIFNQAIKRSTGRESPSERSEERGAWRPFPSVRSYSENTAKYDAMPSGHVMTATMTFTVIQGNYPEYSHIIVPIGVTWVSLLGLQMINNAVHWASDYPLAIAMGWVFGRGAVQLSKPSSKTAMSGTKARHSIWQKVHILPTRVLGERAVAAVYEF